MPDQETQAKQDRQVRQRSIVVRQSRGLLPYGTPEELAELVKRVRFMIPGAANWTDGEVWALAQAAFATGLNPVTQECTWINGFYPQIRGLRRKGREQLDEIFPEGRGRPDLRFVQITTAEERVALHIPEGALAYRCIGRIPAKVGAYADNAKKFADAGAPWDRIEALIGPAPQTEGIGYVSAEEMERLDNPRWFHKCSNTAENKIERKTKSGGKWMARELRGFEPCPECGKETYAEPPKYPHEQRARKRAEAMFWKLEADLPFEIEATGLGLGEADYPDAVSIDGEWTQLDETAEVARSTGMSGEELEEYRERQAEADAIAEEQSHLRPEEIKERGRAAARSLFEDESVKPKRPYEPDLLKGALLTHVRRLGDLKPTKDQVRYVAMFFNMCLEGLGDTKAREEIRHRIQTYLTGKESLQEWNGAELQAALLWFDGKQDEKQKWHPAPIAKIECIALAKWLIPTLDRETPRAS